ncbi:hypothetical protein [uncultured Paludibaculum sp.]|uniref:hypothetical protein n=1 Tax=uncultured Paludibaculum sp. TaxID=1765020 RepID=UPI002AABB0AC|nr:hypothetical protein [uncultured Paludibaculum sp.]
MFSTVRCFRTCWIIGSATILLAQTGEVPAIPKGTQVTVRTLDSIQSKQGEVGQSYRCTMDAPISVAGKEVVSKGADCVLKIVEMKSAGKLTGSNELKLVVSEIRAGASLVAVNSEPTEIKGKGKGKSTGLRTGLGAAAGAGLGAVLGGGKGAAIGAGVGAGAGAASAALTSGPEIKVPSETVLTFVIQ